jgi:hypothetical protein
MYVVCLFVLVMFVLFLCVPLLFLYFFYFIFFFFCYFSFPSNPTNNKDGRCFISFILSFANNLLMLKQRLRQWCCLFCSDLFIFQFCLCLIHVSFTYVFSFFSKKKIGLFNYCEYTDTKPSFTQFSSK